MKKKLRIVLAQLNLTVGDISGNLEKHLRAAAKARDEFSADMIVFPELSLTGYPPEDLLLRQAFIADAHLALKKILKDIRDIYCLVGHPHPTTHGLTNACSLIYNEAIIACYAKQRLPNYGVFDECRYFVPGNKSCVSTIHGLPIGIIICEDIWKIDPISDAKAQGAQCIIVPNASPFEADKHEQRLSVLAKRATTHQMPIVYVNQVGGQDELVFDGGSMVVNHEGKITQFAGFFNETLLPIDIDIAHHTITSPATLHVSSVLTKEEKIYQALTLSVRDYIEKNHFPGAIVGVSGGIDSALTLAIAVDAIGKERVRAVSMPSRFNAEISLIDAQALTTALGVPLEMISIEPTYQAFLASLTPSIHDEKMDVTEENIQARCRGILLMALSNKYGHLVLTTGNRSEMAVGYCTLYGDMAGGFAVLKDIPKTLVYTLANYRNQLSQVIPERTITRPPTAELAPEQKDEDTLPPYSILDRLLEYYLNDGLSIAQIIDKGIAEKTVKKIVSLIHKNEYKRRQAAIGPHINHKSFGRDWRYPNTSGWKG